MSLTLRLLGPPEVVLDGEPATGFVSDKARALLFYLAVERERAHRRETLAGLLWPDYPERSARTNLSNALSNLRTVLADRGANLANGEARPPFFHVSRETIQFNPSSDHVLDVQTFDVRMEAGQWEEAVALYTGAFLEGFSLPDSPAFEGWALVARERLQRQVGDALEGLAAAYEARGDYARAQATARRQLALEPWHEGAHRTLIRCLALDGQRPSALAQYEACARTLREELDVEPGSETRALIEQIRKGTLDRAIRAPEPPAAPGPPPPQALPPASPPAERQAWEGERRLAAVLHVELDQAEALLDELGPEQWTATMGGVQEGLAAEVQSYGGELYERREEGLTALFGVPTAHEDDAERAVLAALAMQEAAGRDVRLRAGVDTGEVLITYAGDPPVGEQVRVVGRVLTRARRASVAAAPGAVQVGENAYRLVRSLFEWQADQEGHRPLAHAGEPGKGRGVPGLSSPLVGRDVERRALVEAVERVRSGVGGIATVVGEAGIGKSRLVTEVRKLVPSTTSGQALSAAEGSVAGPPSDPNWVEGRCLSYTTHVAYQLWLDALRTVLAVAAHDPPATVREALRARVRRLCPEQYDRVYPYLCRLLSLPLEPAYAVVQNAPAESQRAEVFDALEALIEGAALRRPLVLVCEDLHWADPTSLALLERLFALTDRVPLLLICAFRPEREHGCWRLREAAARDYPHRHVDLRLQPLSADQSATLVDHLLRSSSAPVEEKEGPLTAGLPPDLGARILDRAEGNPFYVEEILRSLVESGILVEAEVAGQWRVTGETAGVPLPDTLHSLLTARIDHLEPASRRVLQAASVIGRIFSRRVLAAIAVPLLSQQLDQDVGPGRSPALDRYLIDLQRAQLIRERARMPEIEYAFKHQLSQEAAYNSLLRQQRRAYHRQVAQALERLYADRIEESLGLLAHHWEQAEQAEQAIGYLVRAGEQARAAYANQEAIEYYRRALALLEDCPRAGPAQQQRLTALRGLGIVCFGVGRLDEAESSLQEAIALAQESGLEVHKLVRLYYWLGEVFSWKGRGDEMIRLGEEGLALLGEDSESIETALMNQHVSIGYGVRGDLDRRYQITRRTAGFIHRLPYTVELRPAYQHITMMYIYCDKDVAEAKRWIRLLEENAERHHDRIALAAAAEMWGRLLHPAGKLRESRAAYEEARSLYARVGDAKHVGWCLGVLGQIALESGDPQAAYEYDCECVQIAESLGSDPEVASACSGLGQSLLGLGKLGQAAEAFERALALWQASPQWQTGELIARTAAGWTYLRQGRQAQAAALLQQVLTCVALDWGRSTLLLENAYFVGAVLAGLWRALDDEAAFRAACRVLEQGQSAIGQWILEPAEPGTPGDAPLHEDSFDGLLLQWTWHDPCSDCGYTVGHGLEIQAANGRRLWGINKSAPRLLQTTSGDWIAQCACVPATADRPAIGGLLLWADDKNYLYLSRGLYDAESVELMGCVDNSDVFVGLGRLHAHAPGRVTLRLERRGEQVSATCSADGQAWFRVGQMTFSAWGSVQVGLHASSTLELLRYRDIHPEGSAIRFESFRLWVPRDDDPRGLVSEG